MMTLITNKVYSLLRLCFNKNIMITINLHIQDKL